MVENLWPEFDITGVPEPPVRILNTQASFLAERTQNVVLANVEPVRGATGKDQFFFDFVIVSPALGNFRHRLLTVSHPILVYPLYVFAEEETFENVDASRVLPANGAFGFNCKIKLDSNEELRGTLRCMFASQYVQSLIGSLHSLADSPVSHDQ